MKENPKLQSATVVLADLFGLGHEDVKDILGGGLFDLFLSMRSAAERDRARADKQPMERLIKALHRAQKHAKQLSNTQDRLLAYGVSNQSDEKLSGESISEILDVVVRAAEEDLQLMDCIYLDRGTDGAYRSRSDTMGRNFPTNKNTEAHSIAEAVLKIMLHLGQKITWGKGSEPPTEFTRKVHDAFLALDIHAHWESPSEAAYREFLQSKGDGRNATHRSKPAV